MSLKNTKNLIIIAAVGVALMAGTVLLGSYTNILSSGSETDSQPKTCQAEKSATCTASQAFFAENAEGECSRKAECGSAEKTCQTDCEKPCCAGEAAPGCCPKTGDAAAEAGCCPKTDAAATGCCPGAVTE
jgi:hypothetical protein